MGGFPFTCFICSLMRQLSHLAVSCSCRLYVSALMYVQRMQNLKQHIATDQFAELDQVCNHDGRAIATCTVIASILGGVASAARRQQFLAPRS